MAYKIGQVVQVVTSAQSATYIEQGENDFTIIGTPPNIITDIIYPKYGIRFLNNFGIQARPGSLFAIDGEIIMIGRSGTYEIANDLIQVSTLQMLSEGTFIIDFKY